MTCGLTHHPVSAQQLVTSADQSEYVLRIVGYSRLVVLTSSCSLPCPFAVQGDTVVRVLCFVVYIRQLHIC